MPEAAAISAAGALCTATRLLRAAGVEGARRDARLLLCAATGWSPEQLLATPHRILDPASSERFSALVARRRRREPVSRILGRREFWGLEMQLSTDTLDPRPDSESLVAAVLAHVVPSDRTLRVLDLGTGTGCLLLAVLSEFSAAWGVGVDASPGAIATAQRNAVRHQLAGRAHFVVASWVDALAAPFDVILANPPYVATGDIAKLDPEVQAFDPLRALAGGPDGLAAYRVIVPALAPLLGESGRVFLEVGEGQAAAVSDLLRRHALAPIAAHADLGGVTRCLVAAGPRQVASSTKKGWISSRLLA